LLVGILLISASIILKNDANKLSFNDQLLYSPRVLTEVTFKPIQIEIPDVNVKLPIEKTTITNGTWQIAQNGVSYLDFSSGIGDDTAAIMYSHNTKDRFGPILKLENGDKIKITATDNTVRSYRVINTETVTPDRIDVLTSTKGEVLVLYTCTGFLDSKRFIVKALPII